MLSILAIHLVGLVVCLLPGLALVSLLRPGGRWAVHWALPAGMVTLIIVMYPLSYLVPAGVVGPSTVALAAAVLVATSWRRARGGRAELARAWRPGRIDLVTGGLAAVGSLAALSPLLRLGYPTTVAFTNNDAWYYSGMVRWLADNRAGQTVTEPTLGRPLETVVSMYQDPSLAFGFELYATTVQAITGLEPHRMVGAAAAVAIPVAVSGWVALAQSLGGRITWLTAAMASVAAMAPPLIFGLAENYLTQLVGLALTPFALAAIVMLARRPGWRTLLVAALACGAVLGVYPGMLPWLGLMGLAALALVAGPWPTARLRAPTRRPLRLVARPLLLGLALLVAVAAVATIPLVRAYRFATLASGYTDLSPWPERTVGEQLSLVAGALDHPLLPSTTAIALGTVAVAAAAVLAATLGGRTTWTALGIALAGAAATAVVLWNYRDFNYGYYRALISAGALLAGCLTVALARVNRPTRSRMLALGAIVLCALVWQSGARTQLGTQFYAEPGFRDREIALGERLGALPEGSVVLVDGSDMGEPANTIWYQSQLRMMVGYFATLHGNFEAEGLWSTPTYFSDGPTEQFRPTRAWSHTLMARAASFTTHRRTIWEYDPYVLSRAPAIDIAEYGSGWHGLEVHRGELFKWTHGPAELLVSNRTGGDRRLWVSMRVRSFDIDRTVTVLGAEGEFQQPLIADRSRCLVVPVAVPAGGVTPVWMNTDPGATSPDTGDPRRLALRVDRVSATAARPRPHGCLGATWNAPPPEVAR